MIRLFRTKSVSIVILLILSGCTEKVQERQGSAIEIVPVEYQTPFKITTLNNSKREISTFIDQHLNVFVEKGSEISWSSRQGKQLALFSVSYMIKNGVNNKLVKIKFNPNLDEDIDLSIKHKQYLVVPLVCKYESVERFGYENTGCYAENSRWQSMVNPEKMLSSR